MADNIGDQAAAAGLSYSFCGRNPFGLTPLSGRAAFKTLGGTAAHGKVEHTLIATSPAMRELYSGDLSQASHEENEMQLRHALFGLVFLGSHASATGPSAQPPKDVMEIMHEGDIDWSASRFGAQLPIAILAGDPTKPGPYVVRVKFAPGHMSKPHFHQETRYILVLKGTWWAGWGPSGDHDATVAVPAGSFAIHHPNKIHYDGAKDEEVELLIMGTGPSSITDVNSSGEPIKG